MKTEDPKPEKKKREPKTGITRPVNPIVAKERELSEAKKQEEKLAKYVNEHAAIKSLIRKIEQELIALHTAKLEALHVNPVAA